MKTWYKHAAALFAVCCMSVLLGLSASAETGIAKLEQVIAPTVGEAESITVTTADKFQTGTQYIYFEVSGLTEEYYSFALRDGGSETTTHGEVEKTSDTGGYFYIYAGDYAAGTQTFTLSVANRDETVCYNDISFTIELSDTLPDTEEVNNFEQMYLGQGEEEFSFSFESTADYGGKSMKLLDKDGKVYAATGKGIESYDINVRDTRYDAVFSDAKLRAELQRNGYLNYGNLYHAAALEAGVYDIAVYDGEMRVVYLENAVQVTTVPMIDISNHSQYFPEAHDGDTEFYLMAELTNAEPADFTIKLYDEANNLVAQSTDWLCTDILTISRRYSVKMQTLQGEPLQSGTSYWFEPVSDAAFISPGTWGNTLWIPSRIGDITSISAPDDRFANFVIRTKGYETDEVYRLGLEQSETILGYAIQSPNENGVFDVAFLDENGSVMRLENDSRYSVFLSRYNSYRGVWDAVDEWAYYEVSYSEEAEASLQSFSDVTGNAYLSGRDLVAYAYLDPATASNYQNELFTVRALRVDGTEFTVSNLPLTRKTLSNGQVYLYARFDVTDKLPYAHYKMSLLYNGEIVGEQQYYDVLTELTDVSYSRTSLKNMRGIERFYVYQAEPVTEVKLLLFDSITPSMTPKYTLTLEKVDDDGYAIPSGQHNIFKKYYYLLSVNGSIADAYFYEGVYIIPEAFEFPEVPCTITCGSTEHGSVTVSKSDAAFGDMVYVTVLPDEGYDYIPNSVRVNGKAIEGRSFAAQSDSVVTASFREIVKPTCYAGFLHISDNGTVTLEKERYRVGETVQITVVPNEGYKLSQLSYYNSYTWENVEIPLDTCAFTMPTFDVLIEAVFTERMSHSVTAKSFGFDIVLSSNIYSLYEGETVKPEMYLPDNTPIDAEEIEQLYYRTESGEKVPVTGDSFIMPDEPITIYCTLKKYPIHVTYTGNGNVSVSTNCYEYGEDGDSLLEVPGKTFYGDRVHVSYNVNGSFYLDGGAPLLNGVPMEDQWFVMPKEGVTVSAVFQSDTFKRVTVEAAEHGRLYTDASGYSDTVESDVLGADAGQTVQVWPEAGDGYRLAALTMNGTEVAYDEAAGAYCFIMPDTDVVLRAVFVEDTYQVTFKNYDGTVLFEQRVASGADAAYQGAAPTRPREGNMLYTFTGWDKSLTGITADTEVFAVFKGTVHMEIHNEEELERVRENLDGYYVLAADVTLTKPWTPIGATVIGASSAFTGVFDGDGHTISNVVIAPVNDTNGTNEVSGFFAHIQNAEIKNLGLVIQFGGESDYHSTETRIGGLTGTATGSVISCCYATGTIQSSAQYNNVIGGLVGDASGTDLSDCYAIVGITADGKYPKAGGLLGTAGGGSITNCYSAGKIVLTGTIEEQAVGGLLGSTYYVTEAPAVRNSYYCRDTYSYEYNGYGAELNLADLHSCDTFRDFSGSELPWAYRWDFDNTWVIDKKQNGGFPTLQFKNTRLDLTVTDTLHRPDVNLVEIELDLSKWVKGDLVFAGYRNGKLTCVDTTYKYTESGQFFGGGWHKFYYEGEAPEMVKVMVWKGVGTMMPLCEIAEIKMSAVPVATE